ANPVNVALADGQAASIDFQNTGTQTEIGDLTFSSATATRSVTLNLSGVNVSPLILGTTTLGSNTTFNVDGTAHFQGSITDNGANAIVTFGGAGQFFLAAASNQIGGGIIVNNAGGLIATAAGALGTGTIVATTGLALNASRAANNAILMTGPAASSYSNSNA